jgi:hypothetical protein
VTETNSFELSVTVLLRRSSPGERYRRGGLGPVLSRMLAPAPPARAKLASYTGSRSAGPTRRRALNDASCFLVTVTERSG